MGLVLAVGVGVKPRGLLPKASLLVRLLRLPPLEIWMVSPTRIVCIGIWIIPWLILAWKSNGVCTLPSPILNQLRALFRRMTLNRTYATYNWTLDLHSFGHLRHKRSKISYLSLKVGLRTYLIHLLPWGVPLPKSFILLCI